MVGSEKVPGQMMRAAVYRGSRDISIEDLPVPTPEPHEVLIRVAAVGICGTDAHEYQSGPHLFPTKPFVPGHEFAGHVVEVGEAVTGLSVGDLVASGAGISCGVCHWCRSGATNLCEDYETIGLQLSGGLAQYVVAPADICLEAGSARLSPDTAALAQPMSIAVHAMKRGKPRSGELALVIGAGGIGAFLIHALRQHDVTTLVVDIDKARLDIAKELGADVSALPAEAAEWLSEFREKGVPSVIYEATGTGGGLELALSQATPGTRVVVIGLQDGTHPIEFRHLALRENELIGTNAHAFAADFAEAIGLLAVRAEGWSDVAPVAIPLDDMVELGLRPMVEGRANRIKTLIDPWAKEMRDTA